MSEEQPCSGSVCLCRVLLSVEDSECVVDAERILIPPYSLRVELTRNLSPWKTEIPSIALAIQMGAFQVSSHCQLPLTYCMQTFMLPR